jgi:hypothetical protein
MPSGHMLLVVGVTIPVVLTAAAMSGLSPPALPPVTRPVSWHVPIAGPAPPDEHIIPRGPTREGPGWRAIGDIYAYGALLMTIETERIMDAADIASSIVEPIKNGYVEVLIYFQRPDAPLASRRVQWTPGGGYVELDILPRPVAARRD